MFRLGRILMTMLAAALALGLSATGASAQPVKLKAQSVDLGEMRDAIEDQMNGNAVGFGYAIARNGRLKKYGGGGHARTPDDGGLAFTSKRRIELMSVTKNLTAVGVLRLLDELDISVDEPVHPWLPDEWVQGLGFWGSNGVSFRDLLTHRSGLGQAFNAMTEDEQEAWGNDWDGLEYVVANGANPGSSYKYKNANYALFRILIPALRRELDPSLPEVTEANSWEQYLAYMQDELFEPIGIDMVTCWPAKASKAPLAYDVSDPDAGGKLVQRIGSGLGGCGGHSGLHLSARELVKFQVYLRHTQTLLSSGMRSQMDSLEMGWSGADDGKFWHGGDGYWTNGGVKREIHTCVMKLPDSVEAALVVNSKLTGGKSQCGVLRSAFDEAA